MSIIAAYLFMTLLTLSGAGILSFWNKSQEHSYSFPEGLAVGSTVLAYCLFLLNVLGIGITRDRFFILFGLLLVPVLRLQKPRVSLRGKWSALSIACFLILLLAAITAWMEASSLPVYHLDALAHFGLEAKILFSEGTFRSPFFFDRTIVHEGRDYPLLVPYVEAAYYWFIGRLDDGAVRHLFLFWWIGWLALIYRALRERLTRDWALPLLTLLASLPVFFIDHPGQAVSGCGDIPFALLWSAAVFAALRGLNKKNAETQLIAILCGAGTIFCKPNGMPLVIGLWMLAAVFESTTNRMRAIGTLLMTLAAMTPWFWIHGKIPREITEAPIDWRLISLQQDLYRIPPLIIESLKELARPTLWGGFWLFVIVAGFIGRRPRHNSQVKLLAAILLMQVAAYGAYDVVSPLPVYTLSVWMLTRWCIHISGPLLVWCAWRLEA